MNAEWLHNLHLLRPLWLLALPPLWGLAIWLHRRGGRDGNWSQLIDPALLPALQLEADSGGGRSPWPWLALAWTVAVLALAGPSWQQEQAPAWRGSAAWVVVMDLSPSMAATDLSPDRATRARYAIADLLGQAQDARVGLVVFGGEAFTVTPLTEDVETVRSLLGPLSPDILPSTGDALAPALQQAGELLADRPGQREIIVFTDGFGDASAAFATASRLRSQGIQIHTVEIGTASGAPLPQAQGGFARDDRAIPVSSPWTRHNCAHWRGPAVATACR